MEAIKAKLHVAPLSKYQEIYSEINVMINQLESMKLFIDHMTGLRSWFIDQIKTDTDLDDNISLKKMISLVDIVPVSTLDVIGDMFFNAVLDEQDEVIQDVFRNIVEQNSTVLGLLYESWKEFHDKK